MRAFVGLVALALFTAPAVAQTKFTLDGKNTKVEFTGSKPDGSHDGGFKTVSGTATVKGADPTTLTLSVEIDTDSLYSDNEKLTGHLKSADFFNVKKYPKAKFVSTKVVKGKKGYTVTGDLTMLGKTKSISFAADIAASDQKLTLASSFTINRRDFGMVYGKGKVDDGVGLKVKVTAAK